MATERQIGAATERAEIIEILEEMEEYYRDQNQHEPDDTWLMCWGTTSEIRKLIEARSKKCR